MLSPLMALMSPFLAPRSERRIRNQYMFCACAAMSLPPFQPGKAKAVLCAEPPTKSTPPSRKTSSALSTGKISSSVMSRPSALKKPSSTAAATGK